jgi:hypothetical protein
MDDDVKFLWLAVIFGATALALLIVAIVVATDGRAVLSVFCAIAAAILLLHLRRLVIARREGRTR